MWGKWPRVDHHQPEPPTECVVRQVGDGLQEREGHGLADDGGDLQKALGLRLQSVDARRQLA